MQLHINKELFEQTIIAVFEQTNVKREIIEKDYYVTLILQELTKQLPQLLFKGGTSLSKCYKLIKRFSEDIDLTLEEKWTRRKRQDVKRAIVSTCEKLGLKILNIDNTRSKREFNRYQIDYPTIFGVGKLKQYVYIETSFMVKSFPSETMKSSTIIYDFLKERGFNEVIKDYGLEPYQVRVQTIERTFIDKLFAICDYYLNGKVREHSRHLYDVHMLFPYLKIDAGFKHLLVETRTLRKGKTSCPSAADGLNLKELLQQVIDDDVYKQDYQTITADLLFEPISYEETIKTLKKIIMSGVVNYD